ncbi:MAG TPA: ribonuclease III [Planctomycetota bacterium]|nr:ribonuclease III [Planctomycetota bacterium]
MATTIFVRAKACSDTSFLRLQDRIGYLFGNPSLLERALTHPSSTPHANSDNERMEFLGDSVVNLCVAQALYEWHSDWNEGDLTKVKSCVVSTQSLARAAELIGLRDVGRFGKGLPQNEPLPPSVYANLFEAVTASVYLDGGLEAARAFVLRILGPEMKVCAETGGDPNPKSALQHVAQKICGVTPHYAVVGAIGPDHGKIFEVCCHIGKRVFPVGKGKSKKEAEQEAAQRALQILESEVAQKAEQARKDAEPQKCPAEEPPHEISAVIESSSSSM